MERLNEWTAPENIIGSEYAWSDPQDHQCFSRLLELLRGRGQLTPVHVRQLDGGKFAIIDGHRIYQALVELKAEKVWVFNHGQIDEDEGLLLALELNMNRLRPDVVHLAKAIKRCVQSFGMVELLKRINIDPLDAESYVALASHDWREWCRAAAKDDSARQDHLFEVPGIKSEEKENETDSTAIPDLFLGGGGNTLPMKKPPLKSTPIENNGGSRGESGKSKTTSPGFQEQAESIDPVLTSRQWGDLLNAGLSSGKNFDRVEQLIKEKYNCRIRDLKQSQLESATALVRK